jgi:FkbM family methyltransferase
MRTERLRDELDELLSEDIASAQRREREAFDELASPYEDRLVLFGAGNLGRHMLVVLREAGVEPLAFADNNAGLWGQEIEGVRVLSPEDAAREYGQSAAFVVTIWNPHQAFGPLRDQLLRLGCERVVTCAALFWKYPEHCLPYYVLDLPSRILPQADQIRAAFEVWADEPSRDEYVAQVRLRLRLDFDGLAAPAREDLYFPADVFSLSRDEVFVDCGAFTGDTLAAFLRHSGGAFREIVTLEPDPANLTALRGQVAALPDEIRERVTVLPLAASSRRQRLRFAATGTLTSALSADGDLLVEAVPLDGLGWHHPPTYVKLDVEGAEMDALRGMCGLVHSASPRLAVSVYHTPSDLWQAPLVVASCCDSYRFHLRSYGQTGFDLVCYAVPEQCAG